MLVGCVHTDAPAILLHCVPPPSQVGSNPKRALAHDVQCCKSCASCAGAGGVNRGDCEGSHKNGYRGQSVQTSGSRGTDRRNGTKHYKNQDQGNLRSRLLTSDIF